MMLMGVAQTVVVVLRLIFGGVETRAILRNVLESSRFVPCTYRRCFPFFFLSFFLISDLPILQNGGC